MEFIHGYWVKPSVKRTVPFAAGSAGLNPGLTNKALRAEERGVKPTVKRIEGIGLKSTGKSQDYRIAPFGLNADRFVVYALACRPGTLKRTQRTVWNPTKSQRFFFVGCDT